MAELEQALALVQAHPAADFVGPRDEQLIQAAEAALGLAFPPTYRRFLLELGAGNMGSEEIYGVIDDDFEHSSVPDAIWLTLQDRAQLGLPHPLILIYNPGEGNYALDRSQVDTEGECPVVAWEPLIYQQGGKLEVIASDFGSFFLMLVNEELERI